MNHVRGYRKTPKYKQAPRAITIVWLSSVGAVALVSLQPSCG